MTEKLQVQLVAQLQPDQCYTVRSSANLEDTSRHSYAGQFKSILEVHGPEEVAQAVQAVWQAGRSAGTQAYADRSGQSLAGLQLAVLIQEMVSPRYSGVVFSKNPLTGLNEIVIELVEGRGDRLLQAGQTPERWIYRWGDWIVRPESSALGPDLLRQVVRETEQIARQYGAPVDLEWVYDGNRLYWVQLRPITQLDGVPIYSNRISREVFPGMIKPLIWSINVPLVNSVWIDLFTEMIGPNDLQPDDLARSFGYRAYFNMAAIGHIFELAGFPKESLEILMGLPGGSEKPGFKPSARTLRLLPRLLAFVLGKLRLGKQVLPAMQAAQDAYQQTGAPQAAHLKQADLLKTIERLYQINQQVAYLNVVVPLLLSVYHSLLKRQLSKAGLDYAHLDLTHGLTELEVYDPNPHIRAAAFQLLAVDEALQERVRAASWSELMALEGLAPLQKSLSDLIARFGHLSDSGNDFSAQPWREAPELVLKMVVAEAQRLVAQKAGLAGVDKTQLDAGIPPAHPPQSQTETWQTLALSALRRRLLQPLYQRARRFRLYREAVSSTYTYGYGLFRVYFLELGVRLQQQDLLPDPQHIFYLRWEEIRQILAGELPAAAAQTLTAQRIAEYEACRNLKLPEVIYGDELPALRDLAQPEGATWTGVPSSRGYYCGPARVIRSLADFHKLKDGDVLVIPYSDVGWTTLFTRAGAVVAESGGMLSHSSIVAREFNLPCVVSVSNACQIPEGSQVLVDGYKGVVTIQGEL